MWFKKLLRWGKEQQPSRAASKWAKAALNMELLEDRTVPATFTVSNLNDTGLGSLREAIIDANTTTGADTIKFQANMNGAIHLSYELYITDDVSIVGSGAKNITIDADATSRIFYINDHVDGNSIDVSLSGLRLTDGYTAGRGGAIYNYDENLALNGMVLDGNFAAGSGGAIAQFHGNLTIINSTVSNNVSLYNGGGVYAPLWYDGDSLTIKGSTISGNVASSDGGGLYTAASAGLIENSTISGNSGTHGGGVYIDGGVWTIKDTTISNNHATTGGGVYVNDTDGNLLIDGSTISGNETYGNGAGLFFYNTDYDVTIQDSSIDDNHAGGSGGGISFYAGGSDLSISGTTIANNSALADGGGISFYAGDSSLFIVSSTISGNRAGDTGGGIDIYADTTFDEAVYIKDSHIDGNSAANDGGGIHFEINGDFGYNYNSFYHYGTMHVIGGSISGNTSGGDGGGVSLKADNFEGSIHFTDVTIANNSATQDGGGVALYADGDHAYYGLVTFDGAHVTGNHAGGDGGGISLRVYDNINGDVSINGSDVSGNSAEGDGGGLAINVGHESYVSTGYYNYPYGYQYSGYWVYVGDINSSATISIDGSTFTANASDRDGGGVYVGVERDFDGRFDVSKSSFTSNAADGNGGAISLYVGGNLYGDIALADTTISKNAATGDAGGGFDLRVDGRGAYSSDINFYAVTIADNTADGQGGGVNLEFNGDFGGRINFEASGITGNSALHGEGGGISFYSDGAFHGRLSLYGTSLTDNTAEDAGGGLSMRVTDSIEGDVVLVNSDVSNNHALYGSGGGVAIWAYAIEGSSVELYNSTVTGNRAGGDGGGVAIDAKYGVFYSQFQFEHDVITGNSAEGDGGGVAIRTEAFVEGDVAFNDSDVSQNYAGGSGGGISFKADYVFVGYSHFELYGSTINDNAAKGNGGGVNFTVGSYFAGSSDFEVRYTEISGNTAAGYGGGLLVAATDFYGSVRFYQDQIKDNTSVGGGGGVFVTLGGDSDGYVGIGRSTISGNQSEASGGGLFFSDSGTSYLKVYASLVAENYAGDDGGGLWIDSYYGDVSIVNSTISGNISYNGAGGGIYVDYLADFHLEINNSTIAFNKAWQGAGGGIYANNHLTLSSTIVSDNHAGYAPSDDLGGSATFYAYYSLIESPGSANIAGNLYTTILGEDPLLSPLADNGGSTWTHALQAGSPAINAGDNSLGLSYDQRGFNFHRENPSYSPDIGAFEMQPGPLDVTVVGAGLGSEVKVFNADGTLKFDFTAFDSAVQGVTVALGDVNGDGVADIIVGAASGGNGHVKVFDGNDPTHVLFDFFAFDGLFGGGVNVAAGDVNGDGLLDIIAGAGAGGGPRVEVFSGLDLTVLANFFAFDGAFGGGVNVASGDINGDGYADIICGAGAGGGPRVEVFSGLDTNVVLQNFFAFEGGFAGGVNVAAGDINGDGLADLIVSTATAGSRIQAFSGLDPSDFLFENGVGGRQDVDPFSVPGVFTWNGGLRIAAADYNHDGIADIIAGAAPNGGPAVATLDSAGAVQDAFFAFSQDFTGGVFVG